jgi:hypothetical protein
MALITCPECRSNVSSAAAQCPKCGFPLAPGKHAPSAAPHRSRGSVWILLGCAGVLLLLGGCVLLVAAVPFFQRMREANHAGGASTSQADVSPQRTYEYWCEIKRLHFEAGLANAADKSLDYARIAASMRRLSARIDELPTENVDPEAAACGQAVSDLMLKTAPVFDKCAMTASDPTLVFQAVVNLPAALSGAAGELRDVKQQAEEVRNQAIEVETQIRRARSALSKRHGIDFPLLLPPVAVVLSPYLLTSGYYVVVLNVSSSDPLVATVTYTDAAGASRWQQTGTIAPGASETLDPAAVGVTIGAGQQLTVTTEGYSHTYDVDALLPK